MAGAKETPRQRLIGLMYLVLLALLALQVSSAIMEKFFFLEQSLHAATEEAVTRNGVALEGLKKNVEQRKRENEKQIITDAEKVRAATKEVLTYIGALKEELIVKTAGVSNRNEALEEGGFYKGAKDEDIVATLMVGPGGNKKGKGYELKAKLENFYSTITSVAPQLKDQLQPLTLDGKDDPITKKNPDQRNKDWVSLNFEHTPMVAVMAVLAERENKVANYESLVLSNLAAKVGLKDFKPDKVVAMYRADSRVVAAGTKYKAQMFVSAQFSSINPVMKMDGRTLQVKEGMGDIEFTATGGAYDKDGNLKKTWTGTISMPSPDGSGDTTFTVKGEYVVAKPVIDVKSASVQALYENCGNDLNIQVPALGSSYNPAFSVTNADKIQGQEKGSIIVIPRSKNKVKITVSSDGNVIGDKEFDVRKVPQPQLLVLAPGDRPVNMKAGEKSNTPLFKVVAKPDEGFAAALPKESQYSIGEMEVIVARGSRPKAAPRKFNTGIVPVNQLNVSPGDKLIIDVKRCYRTNFRGEKIEVPLASAVSIITVPFAD